MKPTKSLIFVIYVLAAYLIFSSASFSQSCDELAGLQKQIRGTLHQIDTIRSSAPSEDSLGGTIPSEQELMLELASSCFEQTVGRIQGSSPSRWSHDERSSLHELSLLRRQVTHPGATEKPKAALLLALGLLKVAPANDDCASATAVGNGTFTGDTTEATNDGGASCGASAASPDVWFKYVAPVSGDVVVDTGGSSFDTVLSVHTSCPGTTANQISCNDDGGPGATSAIFLGSVTASDEFLIRVAGFAGDTGAYTLNIGVSGSISGTVVEEATGDPIVGAFVDVSDNSGLFVSSGLTDGSGNYTVLGLPPGDYFAGTFNFDGFVDELYDDIPCPGEGCDFTTGTGITVAAGATTAGIDFALVPGSSISGAVTEATKAAGDPIPGISVGIFDEQGSFFVGFGFTDASGNYTVAGLPDGNYFARTFAGTFANELYDDISCPGFCDPTTGTPIPVTLATPATGIDFALLPGATITGKVTEAGAAMAMGKATGDPVPGTIVEIFDVNGDFAGSDSTDVNGDYAIAGLPPGNFFAATFNFAGFVDVLYNGIPCPFLSCTVTTGTLIPVTVGATVAGVDFALPLPGSFSGTVTEDATGNPVPNHSIYAFDTLGNFVNFAGTDGSGNYAMLGLGPTDYVAAALFTAYLDELYDDVPCPPGGTAFCNPMNGTPIAVSSDMDSPGIDFGLAEQGFISGTVTNASTGGFLTNITVNIFDSAGNFITSRNTSTFGDYFVSDLPAGSYFATTTNSQGFNDELYDDLPCVGGGCDPTTGDPIEVVSDLATFGIDFALALPPGSLSGTVTDEATGNPLAGIQVDVYDRFGTLVASVVTDVNGDYTAAGLIPGSYHVRTVGAGGYVDELFDDISCVGGCNPITGSDVVVNTGVDTANVDLALSTIVFTDGFESGDLTSWSAAVGAN